MHGFLSRDDIAPAEFLTIARHQLSPYPSVKMESDRITDAIRTDAGFEVMTAMGRRFQSRTLLLATGVVDHLPQHPGFRELYGYSVFVCPYCDGWEMNDQPLAIYGRGDDKGGGLALEMTIWSKNIVLCTDGPSELSPLTLQRLKSFDIQVREEKIVRLEGKPGLPHRTPFEIIFDSGAGLRRMGLFFNTGRHQASDLAARLGCDSFDSKGCTVDQNQMTNIPGLYIAGDATRDVLQVVVAAAEGAEAAIAINTALHLQDLCEN